MTMRNRVSFQLDERILAVSGDHLHTHFQPDGGRITVLRRLTGFGYWDTETGYRSPCGKFWLATGDCDIRDLLDDFESDDDMANWVKENANSCVGTAPPRGYRYLTYDELMRVNGELA